MSLALVVALWPSWARAEPGTPPPADEAELASEESREQARRVDLYDQGKRAYGAGDFVGAIEPWQKLYDTVPLLNRVDLFNKLGRAHWEAYQTDHDEEHLVQAQAMFERNLEATYGDAQAERDTREVLDKVDAELKHLQETRAQQEREDTARRAVEEEQARQRRREQAERQARREQERERAERQARLDQKRRRFGVYAKAGGSVAGLGVASLVTAAVGMGLGAKVDRDGVELMATPDARPEEFQDLLRSGRAYNRLAVATTAIGGALVISGATMVVVAAVRLRRAEAEGSARARVVPSLAGMEVRF